MKKIFSFAISLLAMIACCSTFISCGSDDKDETGNKATEKPGPQYFTVNISGNLDPSLIELFDLKIEKNDNGTITEVKNIGTITDEKYDAPGHYKFGYRITSGFKKTESETSADFRVRLNEKIDKFLEGKDPVKDVKYPSTKFLCEGEYNNYEFRYKAEQTFMGFEASAAMIRKTKPELTDLECAKEILIAAYSTYMNLKWGYDITFSEDQTKSATSGSSSVWTN